MVLRRAVFVFVLAAGACGDDGGAAIDAPVVDMVVPVDFDNGSCGNMLRFTGEYVDLDSQTAFCGIFNAVIEVAGGGAMDSTAPNGRFDLCIPDAPTTRLDVMQPAGNSQCTVPAAAYTVPTIFIANKDVILSGAMFSGRAFTTERQTSFFQDQVGAAFDPAKAQVFVHVSGSAQTVTLAAAHGPAQVATATGWEAGDTGTDVFFPNVDVGGGTTQLTVSNSTAGTGAIPLVAGTITNVTVGVVSPGL